MKVKVGMLQKDKNYFIRAMKSSDVHKVAMIDKSCFSNGFTEAAYAKELVNDMAITLVADCDSHVVGYVNARIILDEVYINNIAVEDDSRRNNIGKELLNALEKEVTGKGVFITLEVRESNEIAQRLYSSLGYVKIGKRKNFYINPTENAFIMTKEI